MRFIYNQNPLATEIYLDEKDIKIARLKIEIKDLEDSIFSAQFHLDQPQFRDQNKTNWHIQQPKLYTEEREKMLDDRTKEEIRSLIQPHAGDCICLPCTCEKCYITDILDIDELGYKSGKFNKYVGYLIHSSFQKASTCSEAIEYLSKNPPDENWSENYHLNYEKALDYLREHDNLLSICKGIT